MENKGAVGGGLDDSLFCYFIRIPPQFVLCAVVQFRSKIPCYTENKNTFTLPSRKSTTSPCLFLSRNLLIESLNTRRETFLSIIVSLSWDWPRCKCSESKRKPSLVLGSTPYTCSLSLQITRDFLFLYLGPCPSSVCVYSVQKTQQKTTGFIWDTGRTITHKKNKSSISLLCAWRQLFSEFVLPWHQLERADADAELPNLVVYVKIRKW